MKFFFAKCISPLNYLRIWHREKFFFDVIVPILFTIGSIYLNNSLLHHKISLTGTQGIIPIANGILQILAGFYIASLAAIATASLPKLDQPLKGKEPKYLCKKDKIVTRRVLLTHLFGYLAFMSLTLYFIGGISQIILIDIIHLPEWLQNSLSFSYVFLLFNLVFVTILGLFYMIEDNINQPQ